MMKLILKAVKSDHGEKKSNVQTQRKNLCWIGGMTLDELSSVSELLIQ